MHKLYCNSDPVFYIPCFQYCHQKARYRLYELPWQQAACDLHRTNTIPVAVSSLLCGFELNCDDDIKWVSFTGLCVYLVIVNLSSSACSSALSLWQAWLRPLALFALHLVHLAKSLCCMTVLLSALPHKANRQKKGVGGW